MQACTRSCRPDERQLSGALRGTASHRQSPVAPQISASRMAAARQPLLSMEGACKLRMLSCHCALSIVLEITAAASRISCTVSCCKADANYIVQEQHLLAESRREHCTWSLPDGTC